MKITSIELFNDEPLEYGTRVATRLCFVTETGEEFHVPAEMRAEDVHYFRDEFPDEVAVKWTMKE